MEHFLDTVETIRDNPGFEYFHTTHIMWLTVFILFAITACTFYFRLSSQRRASWRKIFAGLIVADELFKVIMLLIGGKYMPKYLPLHLCSINIILIAIHAFKPSKLLDNFLYLICIPAALSALLFPSWVELPLANFMHIHSFTVHILLAVYPLVLTVCGDIKPQVKHMAKCILLLITMAIPIYCFNLLFDTNFMFLMEAEAGNPLFWFEQHWGNHLLGFPVLIAAVFVIMYIPILLSSRKTSISCDK